MENIGNGFLTGLFYYLDLLGIVAWVAVKKNYFPLIEGIKSH